MIKQTQMILFAVMLLLSSLSYASFYNEHATGWHWYHDPAQEEEEHQDAAQDKKSSDPNEIVSNMRKRLDTSLNTAIVNPTVENVSEFIRLQEELNTRAEKVSIVWKEALLANPHLNYSLNHPTNKIAIDVQNEQHAKSKKAVMKLFAQKTGLFFFYKSTCVYCRRFAPILKSFSERHGIAVIPVSLDGIALPEFPNSRMDSGQARRFQVTVTPSLYAVNPYNEMAFPVAFGLVSESEIEDNIYNIMTKYGEIKL